MNVTFADTFYYLALLNPDDAAHERALAVTAERKGKLVTTPRVLTEVGDAMAAPAYRQRFINLIQTIETDPDTLVVAATDELFHDGVRLFSQRSDKTWPLTDCVSFLVMDRHDIKDALTGDRHFAQAGFAASSGRGRTAVAASNWALKHAVVTDRRGLRGSGSQRESDRIGAQARILMFRTPRLVAARFARRSFTRSAGILRRTNLGHLVSNHSAVITQRNPDTVRGAHVAFYSYERVAKGPLPWDYLPVAPDLVFEVLSRGDRWSNVQVKVAEYLDAGVRAVCVVDDDTRSVHVYRPDQPMRVFKAADKTCASGNSRRLRREG